MKIESKIVPFCLQSKIPSAVFGSKLEDERSDDEDEGEVDVHAKKD